MADEGWLGVWKPMVVDESTLANVRDLAGQPVMGKNNRPNEWSLVNLRTGEFRYPARG